MAFPVGAETVLLTGHVELVDGQAWREPIVLTPSPPEIVSTFYNDIVDNEPIRVVPDRGTGNWSVRLLAVDAAHYVPSGWTYLVERGDRAPYSISLPAAAPLVDLADLTPVSADPGVYDLLVPLADLGGAALLNVGTTVNTVAAGDDSRFGKIGPVTVTGTPATGKVPTATGATTATWQTPAGGGGGSAAPSHQVRIKVENIVLPNTGGWAVVTSSVGTGSVPLSASMAAAEGDRIWADVTFMRAGGGTYLDLAMLNSDGSISEFAASGTSTAPDEGAPEFYPETGSFPASTGTVEFIVGAGQISGGLVTVAQVYKGAGSGTETLYASAGYPYRLLLRNGGPQPA